MQNAAAVRETVQCKIFLLVSSFLTSTTGVVVVSTPRIGSLANLDLSLSTYKNS